MASAGDNLTLNCIAGGFPSPNITWMRIEDDKATLLNEEEGQDLTDFTTSSIYFEELQINDTGIYRCSTINSADTNSIGTNLIVQCKH